MYPSNHHIQTSIKTYEVIPEEAVQGRALIERRAKIIGMEKEKKEKPTATISTVVTLR